MLKKRWLQNCIWLLKYLLINFYDFRTYNTPNIIDTNLPLKTFKSLELFAK